MLEVLNQQQIAPGHTKLATHALPDACILLYIFLFILKGVTQITVNFLNTIFIDFWNIITKE